MPLAHGGHTIYQPLPLASEPEPEYAQLAMAAENGQLVLYVGAGISLEAPTLLPSSRTLLNLLLPIVDLQLGITLDEDQDDELRTLEALADEAEAQGSLEALKNLAASAANFLNAPPNYPHRVLAALLREGAATVFTVNWDRGIEGGSALLGFYLDVTITDADRSAGFAQRRYHKVHGCCSQPTSLLITSHQLEQPPGWVEHEVGAALGGSTFVAVGLGTVGGYVRRRIEQVVEALGEAAPVWIADLHPSRTWEGLLARAGDGHILTVGASEFFDRLLRAFMRQVLGRLVVSAGSMDDQGWNPAITPAVERLETAITSNVALDVLIWLRSGARGVPACEPFACSRECSDALLAVAVVAGAAAFQTSYAGDELVLSAGAAFIELAVWPQEVATVVVDREMMRSQERHGRGFYHNRDWPIFHICVGHRGALPQSGVITDITGTANGGDLVEGVPRHEWIAAESLLQNQPFQTVPGG